MKNKLLILFTMFTLFVCVGSIKAATCDTAAGDFYYDGYCIFAYNNSSYVSNAADKNLYCTTIFKEHPTNDKTIYNETFDICISTVRLKKKENQNSAKCQDGYVYGEFDDKIGCFKKINSSPVNGKCQDGVKFLNACFQYTEYNNTPGGNTGNQPGSQDPTNTGKYIEEYQEINDLVQFIKKLYLLVQIAAPLGIIIMGSLEYAKVVVGDPDKDMPKANKKFIQKIIAGVIVLLMLSVVNIIINAIGDSNTASKWMQCWSGHETCVEASRYTN